MFRKKIQSYFKFYIQRIFILIYGKINTTQFNNTNNDKITEITEIKSDTYPDKRYFLYEIKNGRIFTDIHQNVSIINKDNILSEASFQHFDNQLQKISYNNALINGTPKLKKKISGTIFNLTQGSSGNNYFHFIDQFYVKPEMLLPS